MAKKFVSEGRYKKTTRVKANLQKNNIYKKTQRSSRIILEVLAIIILIIVAVIGLNAYKKESKEESNKQNIQDFKKENVDSFKIGVNKLKTTSPLFSKNLYVNELNKYVYTYFIKIDTDYNIVYEAIKNIEKINNAEYLLEVNTELLVENKKITVYDIKNTIEQILDLEYETPYFNNIKHIKDLEVIDNKLKINLSRNDPYFAYKLQIPVLTISKYNNKEKIKLDIAPQNVGGIYNVMQTDDEIIYERDKNSLNVYPPKLELLKVNSSEEIINLFKQDKIDMFFTSIDDYAKQLGKFEYNFKKVRNGKNVFIFGNRNSSMFSNKEVRRALAHSINKEEIIEEVYKGRAIRIDNPYIYSENKIRHDTIATNNILINAGFVKEDGLYTKDGKQVILTLLVNSEDSKMTNIARIIKHGAEECGMRINIKEVPGASIPSVISSGTYDIVLANLEITEIPDITFINSYVNINDTINDSLLKIENSSVQNMPNEIRRNRNLLNEEMSAIGVVSETVTLIAKKNINGFNKVNYLNIFNNLDMIRRNK